MRRRQNTVLVAAVAAAEVGGRFFGWVAVTEFNAKLP